MSFGSHPSFARTIPRAVIAALLLGLPCAAQEGEQPPPRSEEEVVQAEPAAAVIDAAIERGLAWLCRHQDQDGGWRAECASRCDEGTPCVSAEMGPVYDTGLTALAILALLGTGTTPETPIVIHGAKADTTYDTWEVTQRGVAWLISKQDRAGSVSEQKMMYSDCLAASALCEAYLVNKDGLWRQAAQRAVGFVEDAQAERPVKAGEKKSKSLWGWRYVPKLAPSDTSVTGWAVRAYETADRAGIHVPKAAMAGALEFVEWITGAKGGLVGYLDPAGAGQKVTGHNDQFDYHVGTMSAIAIAVRLRAERKPDKAAAAWIRSAVDEVLLKDLPSAKTPLAVDYYYWHHAAEAWALLGSHGFGKLAETGSAWQAALVEALLSLQSAPSEKCAAGGWLQGDRWAYAGGPVYCTAINVLTLQGLKRP